MQITSKIFEIFAGYELQKSFISLVHRGITGGHISSRLQLIIGQVESSVILTIGGNTIERVEFPISRNVY